MDKADKALGTLLGSAVGDALGMPIDGLSHQNVRTYYKGIKAYRDDEHRRDLSAGQWTGHTQRLFALTRALASGLDDLPARCAEELAAFPLRRPSDHETASSDAATMAAPLGLVAASTGTAPVDLVVTALGDRYDPVALAAAAAQADAVARLLTAEHATLDGPAFFESVTDATVQAEARLGAPPAVSTRLRRLADHLDAFPLDLQDLCNGTGAGPDEAPPFALAMLARNPTLLEATMLPAINVGGAASTVGALLGALLGALHGWAAFPAVWREQLEEASRLEAEATAFVSDVAGSR